MIEKRPFGRTGHRSSAVIFGGAALGKVDQRTADGVLEVLLEHGVNHIDTAPSYGDSELRIGPWMDRHRDDFFLASKTRERGYAPARDEIRRSLERLRTDRIDLIQLHSLSHPDEWDRALSAGGALEACIEAREQGLVRFIGVTGHGWTIAAMHKRALERFDFDSVLLPWNWFVAHHESYAADFEALAAHCAERQVAVQTIKSLARGPWAAGVPRSHATWYQPLESEQDIDVAVRWLLARPGIFLNSVGDVTLLPKVLRAAAELGEGQPELSDEMMAAFSQRAGLASIFGL
ncbi:MAG TPA: aldo/keto reductase [Geminicoccaceae bacterium]|nr:aldo/keto reductase [Geminicoccaceae bacterium]